MPRGAAVDSLQCLSTLFRQVRAFEKAPPEVKALLGTRIKDLGLKLEGSAVEKYIEGLYKEIEERGLRRFRPACYLTDEWACPDREPIIGVPFYLADPKLSALERSMNDLEDEHEIRMYLRHEAGHAFNYAYELYETREWLELFGPFNRPYNDVYTPVPFSRNFVRHMEGWYAQKHPDEDFAESFAVWLTPGSDWRERYRGWPVTAKLDYVERTARALANVEPKRPMGNMELPVSEMEATVEEFYRVNAPDEREVIAELALDVDLVDIFAQPMSVPPDDVRKAAELLDEAHWIVIDRVAYWTGVRRSLVQALVSSIESRVAELGLVVRRSEESATLVEVVAYVSTLAMNYLTRGRFSPS